MNFVLLNGCLEQFVSPAVFPNWYLDATSISGLFPNQFPTLPLIRESPGVEVDLDALASQRPQLVTIVCHYANVYQFHLDLSFSLPTIFACLAFAREKLLLFPVLFFGFVVSLTGSSLEFLFILFPHFGQKSYSDTHPKPLVHMLSKTWRKKRKAW